MLQRLTKQCKTLQHYLPVRQTLHTRNCLQEPQLPAVLAIGRCAIACENVAT
jgi:hypothetical protein